MIKTDNYEINTSQGQYIVYRKCKKSKKIVGYYSTLENAIKGIADDKILNKLDEDDYTLKEAVGVLKAIRDDITSQFK